MNQLKKLLPYCIFAALTFTIMWPLYKPGYVFLLDMVWGPHMFEYALVPPIATHVPLLYLIRFFENLIPLYNIQKIVLTGVLFTVPSLMYALANKYMSRVFATAAGVIYLCNPWVYERFLAGHYLVLFGYALFPLALLLFKRYIKQPDMKKFWPLAVLLATYPIFSLHWSYITYLCLCAVTLVALALRHISFKEFFTRERFKQFSILIGMMLIINLFWLIGFFQTDSTFTQIGTNDLAAYQTQPDPQLGIWINALSLYGFWSSDYILPKQLISIWWLYPLLMILLSGIGFVSVYKKKPIIPVSLGFLFLPALLIGVGYGSEVTKPVIEALYRFLPGFKGLRETAKALGVVAAGYAILAPLGIREIGHHIHKSTLMKARFIKLNLSIVLILISIASSYLMLSGFSGQLKASDYPLDWHVAQGILANEEVDTILALPWHKYMVMSFANHHIISNPTDRFFGVRAISSDLLDNSHFISSSKWDQILFDLLNDVRDFTAVYDQVVAAGVSHIILLKEYDWERYDFLNQSQLLEKFYEGENIIIYRLVK